TGANQQFTAVVQNSTDQSVTWSVNGLIGGGSAVGQIDTNGLYWAPALVPAPATVSVQATTVAAPLVSGSAAVTVIGNAPVSVAVSPASATVRLRHTLQFTAAVQGTSDGRVTWQVNGVSGGNSTVGTITTSGLYTAPGSVP